MKPDPDPYYPEENWIDTGFIGGVFLFVLIAWVLQSIGRGIWWVLCLPARLVRRLLR